MDEVDCYCWSDGFRSIVAGRNQADAEKHANVRFPAVFDGRSQTVGIARSRVHLDAGRTLYILLIRKVVSGYACVAVVTVCGIERHHPVSRQAVFPGRIDEEGIAGLGASAESCLC